MKKILLLSAILLLGLSAYSDNTLCNVTDEGVVINGIRWATRNVDMPGTFAATPESFGMLFQWNRRKGWNVRDERMGVWDSSVPTGVEWEIENDPCPEGWRVPTADELRSLQDAGSEWTSQNRRNGRLFGIAPYQIFLPVAGMRHHNDGTFDFVRRGFYQSSTQRDAISAWNMSFDNHFAGFGNSGSRSHRANGFSVRCVADYNIERLEVLVGVEYEIFETE